MNPIQNFRGPTSIDSQTLEVQTAEKSNAIAYHNSDKKNTNQSVKNTHLSQPAVQRKLDDSEETLQRKETGSTNAVVSSSFQSSVDATKGNGQKMDTNTQGFMAGKFGANFSNVSIHNNSRSHQLATQINAKAFTVGNDIYFNEGEYQPATYAGKHLLAHELTHTLQQNNNLQRRLIQRKCDSKSAINFYTKTKLGKKIEWTTGLVEELHKVVGKAHKVIYENAKSSGKIDGNFVALVCKAQEIIGITGDDIDGKIGPKTITAWNNWKTGGKKGIDYGRLFKDNKLEIGIGVGYDKSGMTRKSKALILAVLNDPKYGLKLSSSSKTVDRYTGKRSYRVMGDNTAAPVTIDIIIDLVDSNKNNPKSTFADFLADKEMTLYVGHARYGTGPDFDPKKSPSENFIIGVNSALHKAGKLKKGYSSKMNKYLKGKKNDLEKLSKAGRFDRKKYQVWFLNACSTIHYMDEIRNGLVTDAAGKRKKAEDLRIMGTKTTVGIGSAGAILKGILEMKTMSEIMTLANDKQGGGKQRYFAK